MSYAIAFIVCIPTAPFHIHSYISLSGRVVNVSFAVNPFESFFSYHYNAVLTVHDARGNSSQDVADIYILPVNQESCFLAGTKVAMADGSYKNIEDVKVGDLVKTYDLEKRRIVEGRVTKVFHHSKDEMGERITVRRVHWHLTAGV